MAAAVPAQARKETLFSRRQIEGLIADGRNVMIVDQKVIKADAWMAYHPGGKKAIQHMVGRDATDEVTAYVFAPLPSSQP
jgi:delta8-fatty-acid desaturase